MLFTFDFMQSQLCKVYMGMMPGGTRISPEYFRTRFPNAGIHSEIFGCVILDSEISLFFK